MIKLYGFSFMKDGVRFDYPFKEMLSCMSSLVEKTYVALGENDDGTSEAVEKFDSVEIIPTVWDMKKVGDGGLIFSEQTNIALHKLRDNHKNELGSWAIYLQSDEIIHEADFEQLRKDIEEAEKQGCDAVRFRYFHFWMSHYQIAVNKRWYPHEIRAIKVNSNVENFGDAQGFSKFTKVYESDVSIFHYGHVRDLGKREAKQKDLINRIRPGKKFEKYLNREKRAFSKTKVRPLMIRHSKVMKDRIEKMGEASFIEFKKLIYVVGQREHISDSFFSKTVFSNLVFVSSVSDVPFEYRRAQMLILHPTLFERVQWGSETVTGMDSDIARAWDEDTRLLVLLSQLFNKHSY